VSVDSVLAGNALSDVCEVWSGIGGGAGVDTGLVADEGLPPAAATTGIRRRGRAE